MTATEWACESRERSDKAVEQRTVKHALFRLMANLEMLGLFFFFNVSAQAPVRCLLMFVGPICLLLPIQLLLLSIQDHALLLLIL